MASATFDDLKTAVAMKVEESGALPTAVSVGGTQYTLQVPAEAKARLIQVVKNPVRLDAALDLVTFVSTDGTTVHA
jgi:hypothetical protein